MARRDNFKGLKLRAIPNPVYGETLKALGVKPAPISSPRRVDDLESLASRRPQSLRNKPRRPSVARSASTVRCAKASYSAGPIGFSGSMKRA